MYFNSYKLILHSKKKSLASSNGKFLDGAQPCSSFSENGYYNCHHIKLFTLIYISWVIQDEWHVVFCGAQLPTKLLFKKNENSKNPRWHSEFWFTTPTLSNTPPRHNHCQSDLRITTEGYKCLTCLGRKWWKQKHNETGLERIPIEGEGCILKWNTMVIVFVMVWMDYAADSKK